MAKENPSLGNRPCHMNQHVVKHLFSQNNSCLAMIHPPLRFRKTPYDHAETLRNCNHREVHRTLPFTLAFLSTKKHATIPVAHHRTTQPGKNSRHQTTNAKDSQHCPKTRAWAGTSLTLVRIVTFILTHRPITPTISKWPHQIEAPAPYSSILTHRPKLGVLL
jgi:hypothetical protein